MASGFPVSGADAGVSGLQIANGGLRAMMCSWGLWHVVHRSLPALFREAGGFAELPGVTEI